jgi:hypothetical protein
LQPVEQASVQKVAFLHLMLSSHSKTVLSRQLMLEQHQLFNQVVRFGIKKSSMLPMNEAFRCCSRDIVFSGIERLFRKYAPIV